MAVDIVHHHLELIFLDWVVVTHAAAEQQAEEQQQRDPAPPAFHSGDQHAQHQRNAERGGIEVAIDKQRRAPEMANTSVTGIRMPPSSSSENVLGIARRFSSSAHNAINIAGSSQRIAVG